MKPALVFSVTLSQLIANGMTSMANMCSPEGNGLDDLSDARSNWNLTKIVIDDLLSCDRDRIASQFRSGFTMMMLPEDVMNGIEKLVEDDRDAKFYVEVAGPHAGEAPLVIHSDDVNW